MSRSSLRAFWSICISLMTAHGCVAATQNQQILRGSFRLGLGERHAASSLIVARFKNTRRTHCAQKCLSVRLCKSFMLLSANTCQLLNRQIDETTTDAKSSGQQYYSKPTVSDTVGKVVITRTRLLILRRERNDNIDNWPLYNLRTENKTVYPFIKPKMFAPYKAITYISSTKRILVSTEVHPSHHGGRILSYQLDSYNEPEIVMYINCLRMTAEESGKLVFMFVGRNDTNDRFLSRMTNSGKFYQEIYKVGKKNIKGIAADSRKRLVFVCISNKIISLHYDGTKKKILYTVWCQSLAIDIKRNVLYITLRNTVQQLCVTSCSVRELTKIKRSRGIHEITYYNNEIFVASRLGSDYSMAKVNLFKNSSDSWFIGKSTLLLCLLP